MKPRLVRFDQVSSAAYDDYMREWEAAGELVVPRSSERRGRSFAELLDVWKRADSQAAFMDGFVPSTLFFFVRDERIVGALSLRHELNDALRLNGGHIGYGIRPSERRRGYAKAQLKAALRRLRPDAEARVLLTCDDDNIASARTIEACGGVLEDKPLVDGKLTRRYWISLAP